MIKKKIYLKTRDGINAVDFREADANELDDIFQFRYANYLSHNYIYPNDKGRDIDEYDDDGSCKYFIAKIGDRIVGHARLILADPLPTQKDCFDFDEPVQMRRVAKTRRGEVSRLIVERHSEDNFPRHLIMLGLIYCITEYAAANGILGGYSFVKEKLYGKLESLKFPFHCIDGYVLKYKQKTLEKYFSNPKDKVVPIYFLTNEVSRYIRKYFKNPLIFRRYKDGSMLRGKYYWNFFRAFWRVWNVFRQ